MPSPATLAVITKNRVNPAYGGALVGARAVASRHGARVSHRAPERADDVEQQAALIREAVRERPHALVLIPAHATALTAALDEVAAAGIPLFMLVSRPHGGRWVSYVGSDDRQLAATMARALIEHLGGSGTLAIVDGHPGSITTPLRHEGYRTEARTYPGVRIAEAVFGFYQRAPAHAATRDLLRRHPELDGLLVSNDLMALGVLDALDEAGRRLPVVSANGTPDAVAAIKAGRLLGSVSFDTLSFGALAAEAALRYLRGESVPAAIELPSVLIHSGNVASWDRPYEQRQPVSWDDAVRQG